MQKALLPETHIVVLKDYFLAQGIGVKILDLKDEDAAEQIMRFIGKVYETRKSDYEYKIGQCCISVEEFCPSIKLRAKEGAVQPTWRQFATVITHGDNNVTILHGLPYAKAAAVDKNAQDLDTAFKSEITRKDGSINAYPIPQDQIDQQQSAVHEFTKTFFGALHIKSPSIALKQLNKKPQFTGLLQASMMNYVIKTLFSTEQQRNKPYRRPFLWTNPVEQDESGLTIKIREPGTSVSISPNMSELWRDGITIKEATINQVIQQILCPSASNNSSDPYIQYKSAEDWQQLLQQEAQSTAAKILSDKNIKYWYEGSR